MDLEWCLEEELLLGRALGTVGQAEGIDSACSSVLHGPQGTPRPRMIQLVITPTAQVM